MGVSNPPHTFLLDKNKNIAFEHSGYASGDEAHLYEQIKKLVEEKKWSSCSMSQKVQ
jgi:hypothetical protein